MSCSQVTEKEWDASTYSLFIWCCAFCEFTNHTQSLTNEMKWMSICMSETEDTESCCCFFPSCVCDIVFFCYANVFVRRYDSVYVTQMNVYKTSRSLSHTLTNEIDKFSAQHYLYLCWFEKTGLYFCYCQWHCNCNWWAISNLDFELFYFIKCASKMPWQKRHRQSKQQYILFI